MRASLQIDSTPTDGKVDQLHAQMLAEIEALNHRTPAKDGDKAKESSQGSGAKVKGVEAVDNNASPKTPKNPKTNPKIPGTPKTSAGSDGAGHGGIPCSFYTSNTGCKKGSDCTFVHNWSAFSQSERASRCKTCGARGLSLVSVVPV